MTDVTITIEPEPHGYGQHMIIIERSGTYSEHEGAVALTAGTGDA